MILGSDASDTLLDLSTGNFVYTVPRVEFNDRPAFVDAGPTLLMNVATPHLVHQQREGVRILSPDNATNHELAPDVPLSQSFPKPRYDPRSWRNPVASPLNMADRTLTNMVANLARAGVQSLFAFIIPLAGISWLMRKRRFSLAQLSLAPLAALACLMTWKTMLTSVAQVGRAGQEPWYVVLFTGTMVVAAAAFVVRSILQRRVWILAVMVALAAAMTAAVQLFPALLAADDIHYRLRWTDFLAGVILGLIVLLPPGLVVWSFVQFVSRRLGRRGSHAG
jgi:hypothetical protein